jgi:putative ABC transport system permease protein
MREIATLKLIGAPDRTIIGLIVQQALAMGAVGFLFATAFVHTIRPYFPRRVELLANDAGALAAVLLLICLMASGLGVRFALKVDPATALGG